LGAGKCRPRNKAGRDESGKLAFPSGGNVRLAATLRHFTDIAVSTQDRPVEFRQALSTPDRLVNGISNGVGKAAATTPRRTCSARLDGRDQHHAGAHRRQDPLVTTEGFRDVYEIGRINRPDAYNLYFQKHKPRSSGAVLRGQRARPCRARW